MNIFTKVDLTKKIETIVEIKSILDQVRELKKIRIIPRNKERTVFEAHPTSSNTIMIENNHRRMIESRARPLIINIMETVIPVILREPLIMIIQGRSPDQEEGSAKDIEIGIEIVIKTTTVNLTRDRAIDQAVIEIEKDLKKGAMVEVDPEEAELPKPKLPMSSAIKEITEVEANTIDQNVTSGKPSQEVVIATATPVA